MSHERNVALRLITSGLVAPILLGSAQLLGCAERLPSAPTPQAGEVVASQPAAPRDEAPSRLAERRSAPPPERLESFTREMRLDHAPHSVPAGAPHVVVHGPTGLSVDVPLQLVVFLHGWNGCARVLSGAGQPSCFDGGPSRAGWGLSAEHDGAGTNTLFLVLQLAWLARTGDPGRLEEAGFFASMLEEVLSGGVGNPPDGARTLDDVGSITLVAHSAGYEAARAILEHGGVREQVKHVVLMDALYGDANAFVAWLAAEDDHRLISLYTGNRTTHRQNRVLRARIARHLGDEAVRYRPTQSLADAMAGARAVISRSPHPHGAIPQRQLAETLRALALHPR